MSSVPEKFGPYVDLKALKGGGFGQVYTGRHSVLGRTDAIKMLAPGLIQSDEDNERFYREASAMAQLDHPHIVRVYNAGVEMGFPYIAMAYVAGDDLGDLIRARGPLEIADVVRLGREISSALAHMHGEGIIHRDLKSSNVLRR
ncbi:MAG: serine/threonine-protein kinase, partial [Bacteroidota bacterium]